MNRTAFVLLSLLFSAIIGGYCLTQSSEKIGIPLRPAYPTEIYASKVMPVVQSWASDAELILAYGSEYCQQILCDVHPMSPLCICNDSAFGDGKTPQWTFVFYSKQKGELMKVDAYIAQEEGQKRWQIVSKTYKTPIDYSGLGVSLSNPPENHTDKPRVYILFRNQWKPSFRPLNITATNFAEFKRLILAESKSPTVYGGVLILPDGKIGDLVSPTIIIRTQFNQSNDMITVVYPGVVLRGYAPRLPCKLTSLENYSQSISTVIERLASPEFSGLKLILGQPYVYYELKNGTIKIETLDCDLMTIHYSPSAKISLPIPAVGYSEFNVTQYSSVLENLSSETYMYQEVWLTEEEAKARGYDTFPCPKSFLCECRADNECSCRRSWSDCVYISKCYYFFMDREDLEHLYQEKLKEWGGYWP